MSFFKKNGQTLKADAQVIKTKGVVRQIFAYTGKIDIALFIMASMAAVVQGALAPLMTIVYGSTTNDFVNVQSGRLSTENLLRRLLRPTLYMISLAIAEAVMSFIMWMGFTIVGETVTRRIRERLLAAILEQGVAGLSEAGPGEVLSRIGADADLIQDVFSSKLGRVVATVASVIAAFCIAYLRNWRLALMMSSGLLAFGLVGALFGGITKKQTDKNLGLQEEASAVAQEHLGAMACIMASSAQGKVNRKYQAKLDAGRDPAVMGRILGESMMAVISCVASLLFALAFWQGSRYFVAGSADPGDIMTILLSVLLGTANLAQIAPHVQALVTGNAGAKRIFEAISRPITINSASEQGEKPQTSSGLITFKDVYFAYPSRPESMVFNGLNLTIQAGKSTAFVGTSGCGKSTIINLVQRFYDPTSGVIEFDHAPLKTLSLQWLRRQMAVVSQEPDLFDTTIYENIAHGLYKTGLVYSEEEERALVIHAANTANAHGFIMLQPKGYDTIVGERGALLSGRPSADFATSYIGKAFLTSILIDLGGQRQRIAIARALVSDPKVLLLDEATSALDTVAENFIQNALAAARPNRTVIIIAHRLSTVMDADCIVVLDKHGIAEQGTYHELCAMRGAFDDLVRSQNAHKGSNASFRTNSRQDSFHDASNFDAQAISDENNRAIVAPPPLARQSVEHLLDKEETQTERPEHQVKAIDVLRFVGRFNSQSLYLGPFGLWWAIVAGGCSTVQSYLLAEAITQFSANSADVDEFLRGMDTWTVGLVVLSLGQCLTSVLRGSILAVVTERFIIRARKAAFGSILRQDMAFFDSHDSASLASTLSTHASELNGIGASLFGTFITGIIGLLSAIGLSIGINWRLGLVYSAAVPPLLLAGYLQGVFASQREHQRTKVYGEAVRYSSEAVDCIATVASLTLEPYIRDKFHKLLAAQGRRSMRSAWLACCLYAISQSVQYFALAGGFYYGGWLLSQHKATMLEVFICFTAVISATPVTGASFGFLPDVHKGIRAARSIAGLLARKPAIDISSDQGSVVLSSDGNVALEMVKFKHPARPKASTNTLENINFEIDRGQFVAIVGPSGSGKSSILSLVERFYDPQAGKALHDGIDMRKLHLKSLRRHMAFITQDTALFSGNIRENILLASPRPSSVSEKRLRAAISAAALDDLIASLPEGLDTVVGYRGLSLSGGQRQRIAVARALLTNPSILLLDEATSALDSNSEQIVLEAINDAAHGRTTIAVAQRLSTIRGADCIYVVDQGSIVEAGTHRQLLSKDGLYAHMVRIQGY